MIFSLEFFLVSELSKNTFLEIFCISLNKLLAKIKEEQLMVIFLFSFTLLNKDLKK